MRVPTNPVLAARAAVPNVKIRDDGLDHRRAPSDEEVEALLAALRADPVAGRMAPGIRHKSAHDKTGEGAVNGKDIADLALLSFRTGERIGELGAAMWGAADGCRHAGGNRDASLIARPGHRPPAEAQDGGQRRKGRAPPTPSTCCEIAPRSSGSIFRISANGQSGRSLAARNTPSAGATDETSPGQSPRYMTSTG